RGDRAVTRSAGQAAQAVQQGASPAAPRPAPARRLAPAPRRAPAAQHIVGNHGALRRPDAAEHEARHTARRVAAALPAPARVRRGAASRAAGATLPTASPLGAGMRLPSMVLAAMEAALGADFGSVRIHVDGRAASRAREARAKAIT